MWINKCSHKYLNFQADESFRHKHRFGVTSSRWHTQFITYEKFTPSERSSLTRDFRRCFRNCDVRVYKRGVTFWISVDRYSSGSNLDTGWFNSGDGRATVPEEVVVSFSSRMMLFIIPSTLWELHLKIWWKNLIIERRNDLGFRSCELWEPSMTATRNHVLYYPTNLVRLPHDRVIPLIYFVPDPRRSARSDWFPWPSWSGEERAHAQWPQLTRGRDPDLRPHLLHL